MNITVITVNSASLSIADERDPYYCDIRQFTPLPPSAQFLADEYDRLYCDTRESLRPLQCQMNIT